MKMGSLILKLIFKEHRVQTSFMPREEKMEEAVFVKTQVLSRIPLMISMSKAEFIKLKSTRTTQT